MRRTPSPASARLGYTLVETVLALVIVGVVIAMAAPSLTGFVTDIRRRGALDRVATSIYYARGIAVETGRTAYLVLRSSDGCITRLEIGAGPDGDVRQTLASGLSSADSCLHHTGDSLLVFNSRGIMRPPSRSIFSGNGGEADSVVISVAGRVRRTY